MINGRKTGFFAAGAFSDMPIEKACSILKNIGYDAIELHAGWLDAFDNAGLRNVTEKITESGLVLSEVIVQQDYVTAFPEEHRLAIEETKRHMYRFAEAGINTINVFTGPRPWIPNRVIAGEHISVGKAWDMVFAAYDELVPLAEKLGIGLALENVWGMVCNDFFTAQYLIKRYNSPAFGVNYDPSHDMLAGNNDMEFNVTQWGKDNIKHIHMKDAAGIQKRGYVLFPQLGAGLVDWAGFCRGLDAIGYDGVLSVEYEAGQYMSTYINNDWVRAAEESYHALEVILG